jgi:DNA-binding PadR family transcriptional regulator
MESLTALQRDVLIIIAGGNTPYGDEIRQQLEAHYNTAISDGGLYGSLNTLADHDLIETSGDNSHHTQYKLTRRGEKELTAHAKWWSQTVSRDILKPSPPYAP